MPGNLLSMDLLIRKCQRQLSLYWQCAQTACECAIFHCAFGLSKAHWLCSEFAIWWRTSRSRQEKELEEETGRWFRWWGRGWGLGLGELCFCLFQCCWLTNRKIKGYAVDIGLIKNRLASIPKLNAFEFVGCQIYNRVFFQATLFPLITCCSMLLLSSCFHLSVKFCNHSLSKCLFSFGFQILFL